MTISYDKLWKLLIDKKMNRTDLKNVAGVSFNVLAKMSRNESLMVPYGLIIRRLNQIVKLLMSKSLAENASIWIN